MPDDNLKIVEVLSTAKTIAVVGQLTIGKGLHFM